MLGEVAGDRTLGVLARWGDSFLGSPSEREAARAAATLALFLRSVHVFTYNLHITDALNTSFSRHTQICLFLLLFLVKMAASGSVIWLVPSYSCPVSPLAPLTGGRCLGAESALGHPR